MWKLYCDLLRVTKEYRADFTKLIEEIEKSETKPNFYSWSNYKEKTLKKKINDIQFIPKPLTPETFLKACHKHQINKLCIKIPPFPPLLENFRTKWSILYFFDPKGSNYPLYSPFTKAPIKIVSWQDTKNIPHNHFSSNSILLKVDLACSDREIKENLIYILKNAREKLFNKDTGKWTSRRDRKIIAKIWKLHERGIPPMNIAREIFHNEFKEINVRAEEEYEKQFQQLISA